MIFSPLSTAYDAGKLPFLIDQLAARYGEAVTPKDQQVANAFNILTVLILWLVSRACSKSIDT